MNGQVMLKALVLVRSQILTAMSPLSTEMYDHLETVGTVNKLKLKYQTKENLGYKKLSKLKWHDQMIMGILGWVKSFAIFAL